MQTSNISGTISNSFKIGNNGITIYNGSQNPINGQPINVRDGDLYIKQQTNSSEIYQYNNSKWISISPKIQNIVYNANIEIDWDLGDVAYIELTGDVTINMIGNRLKCLLIIKQDAIGNRNVTWGSNIRFGVDIPSIQLTQTANKKDKIGLSLDQETGKYDVIGYSRGF